MTLGLPSPLVCLLASLSILITLLGVRDIIMVDIESVLVGAVNLELAVSAVIGVACNHIELGFALCLAVSQLGQGALRAE